MERLSLEDRDLTAPPSDSLAEGVVLHAILEDPRLLDRCDLRPLLLFPEHRWCYDAMRRVWDANREQAAEAFFLNWRMEMARAHPNDWRALVQLVIDAHQDETYWMFRRHDDDVERDPGEGHRVFAHQHDWQWWVQRLERIAISRGVISKANDVAQRGWACDVEGAIAATEEIIAMYRRVQPATADGDLLQRLDV